MECRDCGHDIPEGKGSCIYCGAVVKSMDRSNSAENGLSGHGSEGGCESGDAGEYVTQELSRIKSRRKNPLSKTALACIFFLSMLVGGVIVWLFK